MVTDTSIEAYHALLKTETFNKDCRAILVCLIEHGPQADYELAARLNRHQSKISARRGDLINEQNTGYVVFTGRYTTSPKRKTVKIWSANITRQASFL